MIGLFGGTFDPVHLGHLQSALDVQQILALDSVRFIPCQVPPHRGMPCATGEQRLAMLHAAVADEPSFVVDDTEMQRPGPSYTYDTLSTLRATLDASTPLVWILGADAFAGLPSWHRWTELLQLAHLAVMTRPEQNFGNAEPLHTLLAQHETQDRTLLHHTPAGLIYRCAVTPLAISASRIREDLAVGRSVRYLVPAGVFSYLTTSFLYSPTST